MESFDKPVVLFLFKRYDTVLRILERISQVKPQKLYLICDGPRNDQEAVAVSKCREEVERHITWPCEVIKNYAEENRGIYDRIGLGAKWVFTREEKAIFLEDDNLPEVTFFAYSRELLERYEHDTRVLWINGTNYLARYTPGNNASYMFTKHLLPCGWASWASKFPYYYDGEMSLLKDKYIQSLLPNTYENQALYRQQRHCMYQTLRKKELGQPISWDFQMAFSVRIHGMYGISPCCNQIKNIGVDLNSEHGGTSYKNPMTRRFCGMDSHPLELPLRHPAVVQVDPAYEKKIEKIILYPFKIKMFVALSKAVKPLLGMDTYDSLSTVLKKRKQNHKNRSRKDG